MDTPWRQPKTYIRYGVGASVDLSVRPVTPAVDHAAHYEVDSEDEGYLVRRAIAGKQSREKAVSREAVAEFERTVDELEMTSFERTRAGTLSMSALIADLLTQGAEAAKGVRESESGEVLSTPLAPCDVCALAEGTPSNELLTCASCAVRVHQGCYGVHEAQPATWQCDACLLAPPPVAHACAFCSFAGGALKPLGEATAPQPRLAHVSCALMLPGVRFADYRRMAPIEGTPRLFALRAKSPAAAKPDCAVCGEREREGSALARCPTSNCNVGVHVVCARKVGLRTTLKPAKASSCLCPYVYCPTCTERETESAQAASLSLSLSSKARPMISAVAKATGVPYGRVLKTARYWSTRRRAAAAGADRPLLNHLRLRDDGVFDSTTTDGTAARPIARNLRDAIKMRAVAPAARAAGRPAKERVGG